MGDTVKMVQIMEASYVFLFASPPALVKKCSKKLENVSLISDKTPIWLSTAQLIRLYFQRLKNKRLK